MAELLDQADRLELAQRLADRRAADAEAGGQVLLAEARPERDAAGDDLDLELVGQVVGAREAGRAAAPCVRVLHLRAGIPYLYPVSCSLDPKSTRVAVAIVHGGRCARARQASRDRAHQGPQGRSRRARRHLPLRRARLRRDRARRPGAVSLVRRLHPARRGVGGVRRPGPVRGDRRATSCCASSSRTASSPPTSCAPIGRLSERYGRGMGDITTRQNIQLHWLRDRGHAGRPRRAERRRALVHPGLRRRVAKRRRLPARRRRRARADRLAAADRGARAHVRRRPPLLEPAAQVQGVGVGRACTAARSTRSTTSGSSRSRRTASSATTCGSAAASARRPAWAGGWTCSSLPEEAADVCRAITEIFRDEGKRTKRTRARIKFLVDEWGVERLRAEVEEQARPRAADVGRPGRSRSIRTATTWASTRRRSRASTTSARPRCAAGSPADQMIARRRHRRPVRLGRSCAAPTART